MDINQIRQLLAKYFNGDTTLEEEKALRSYFEEKEPADPEFALFTRQTALIKAGRNLPFDAEALESKILDSINQYEQLREPPVRKLNMLRLLVAASVTIAVGVSAFLLYQSRSASHKDTYNDPQLAYLETKKTLLYVSSKINKGMDPLSQVSKINTGTAQLKNLDKMDEGLGMLNLVSFINQSSNLKK